MGAVGHCTPTLIGVPQRDLAEKLGGLVPGYMAMGSAGMADMQDMAEMGMPLPPNTLPMMSGQGPYGALEMGGMFTTLKVRRGQRPGDYSDPGWYANAGPVAHEVDAPAAPVRAPAGPTPAGVEVRALRQPPRH